MRWWTSAVWCVVLGCGDDAAVDGGGRDSGTPPRDGGRDAGPLGDSGGFDASIPDPIVCDGNCRYVRAGASGDGSDWTNALGAVPDSLERDVVYFVAAGEYGEYSFDDPASGEAWIRVVKATVGEHGTDDGWDPSYGTQATFGAITFSTDYVDFDGRTGGGPGQWESGFGFRIRSGGHNVHLDGDRRSIRVAHVDIENNGRYAASGGNEHSFYGVGAIRDIVVSHCFLHDVNGVQFLTRAADGFVVEYSKLSRNGPVGFDDGHREAWSAAEDDNVTIRYSIFEDISNTAILGLVNGVGTASNWRIYGNVFWQTEAIADAAVSALISVRYADPHFITVEGWEFHHNTVVNIQGLGAGYSSDMATPSIRMFNNVWFHNEVNAIGLSGEHDHNWFFENLRTDGCPTPCNLDTDLVASEPNAEQGSSDPFSDWRSGDFTLAAPTSAGRALEAPYDRDMFGTLRGADGSWDRGAIEL